MKLQLSLPLLLACLAVCPALRSEDDYELGPDSQRKEGVPQGRVEGPLVWKSSIFEGTIREYSVYVPAQYDPAHPACVMVFQDGHQYVNTEREYRVPIVFDNLIHAKEMPVTIGIFINPGHRGEELPENPWRGSNRSFEYDSLGDQYARFLLEEILPEVGKKYNLTTEAAGRAICGVSSGGICAFTVAWERPDQFSKVVSHIGSFTNIRGGHVYPALIRKGSPVKPIRVFLQDGSNDLDNQHGNWPLANQQMAAALKFRGYDYQFVYGDGGHTHKHGGSLLPDTLRWTWRDYPKTPAEVAASKQASVDPSGTWKWEREFGDAVMNFTLRMQVTDGKLAGTLETLRDGAAEEPLALEGAKIDGDKVSFHVTRRFNDNEFTIDYVATVTEDSLDGMVEVDFGGTPREFEWSARRVVELADVIGTWKLSYAFREGNTAERTLTISKEGDGLKGVLSGGRSGDVAVEGLTIEKGELAFAITRSRNGNEFKIEYRGKPRGRSLEGTVTFNRGGEPRSVELNGTLQPPSEEL